MLPLGWPLPRAVQHAVAGPGRASALVACCDADRQGSVCMRLRQYSELGAASPTLMPNHIILLTQKARLTALMRCGMSIPAEYFLCEI